MILSRGLSVLIVFGTLLAGQAGGQEKAAGYSSVKMAEDRRLSKAIEVAHDLITDKEWNDAVKVLQAVLDQKEDRLIGVRERDPGDPRKEMIVWRSARIEANNLIGLMPAGGLKVYEETFGADARKLLDTAVKPRDDRLLAEVALRYRHTKAGSEAIKLLAKSGVPEAPKLDGWPSWRGNSSNTAQADAGVPILEKKLWSRPVMLDKLEGLNEVDPDEPAKKHVDAAIKQVRDLKQPVLPGFFPIATQGIVVFRTQRDVRAVAIKTIKIKDPETGEIYETPAGHVHWKAIPFRRSLSVLLEKNDTRGKVDQWLNEYGQVPGLTSVLYENTLIGTLATDGRNVYMVDDLAVPPDSRIFEKVALKDKLLNPQNLKPLLVQNELAAYELHTGKLNWALNERDDQFKDSHFLSVPISVDGKLYVLNEKILDMNKDNPFGGESELRLICIDPSKINAEDKPAILAPPLVLGKVAEPGRMVQDLSRRVNTAALAYADGILVCPTNAGEVFGIELPTRSLAWAYSYRESAPQPIALPGMKGVAGTTVVSKWKPAPPTISNGKVVFTGPDADSVHCVNLRDGKPLWKKKQQKGDLYLAAVFSGRALIVAEKTIRALDLKDGGQVWSLDIGDLPAGQGAANGGVYYLPLQKEILAIDIVKGQVKAHHRVPDGGLSPGNLVFYDGMLLSQTPTDVTAYPQLKEN
jgi:PQQ-like domain